MFYRLRILCRIHDHVFPEMLMNVGSLLFKVRNALKEKSRDQLCSSPVNSTRICSVTSVSHGLARAGKW
jgi:hypothetical protein